MRLQPSDPDIATIVARITSGDLDLQPEFQRGEVWNTPKKRKLIDSILRNWHVPPIHIIENRKTATQEVLDGQQRLVAIRDFVHGEFTIDGNIAPFDQNIASLDGCTYSTLPPTWRRRFDQFSIRLFRITDYEPEEPSELFFRLNQPVALTAAEQRNAFFGPIRDQVREMVHFLMERWSGTSINAFSNSRMALDDVIAKFCFCLERGHITDKVLSSNLADRYRNKTPFDKLVLWQCERSIDTLCKASQMISESSKFNKATLFSGLWFVAGLLETKELRGTETLVAETFELLEHERRADREGPDLYQITENDSMSRFVLRRFLEFYSDRSSSRVSDVVSVVGRDVVLWIFCALSCSRLKFWTSSLRKKFEPIADVLPADPMDRVSPENCVIELLESKSWGTLQ